MASSQETPLRARPHIIKYPLPMYIAASEDDNNNYEDNDDNGIDAAATLAAQIAWTGDNNLTMLLQQSQT